MHSRRPRRLICHALGILLVTIHCSFNTVFAVSVGGAVANHVSKFFEAEVTRFSSRQDAKVTYTYQVSREALRLLSSGSTNFAITQNTAPDSGLCTSHKLLSFPILVGVGGFYHNAPGISSPKLDACAVAGIFAGRIRMWNDPAIRKTNPGISLPSKPINVIIREDNGPVPLTSQLLQYIKEQCPEAAAQLSSADQFPAAFQRVVKIRELVDAIGSTPYSIGYVQASSYPGGKEVAVQNRDGQFVTATSMDTDAFAAALQEPSPPTCWGAVKTTNLAGRGTHPMTFLIYFVAHSGRTSGTAAQRAVAQLASQLLSPASQARAAALGFGRLPARLHGDAETTSHLLVPAHSSGSKRPATAVIAGVAVGALAGLALVAAVAALLVRQRRRAAADKKPYADGNELVTKATAPVQTHGVGNLV